MLDQMILDLNKPARTYEQGWEYQQAHYNGELESLLLVRKLISEK